MSAPAEALPPESVRFIVQLAEALHRRGIPAHRLEDAMADLSRALGEDAGFFSTPTSLMIRFGPPESSRTTLLRVDPVGAPNLGQLAELDRIAERVARGELSVRGALEALAEVDARPPAYPAALGVLAAALTSGAASVLFGATLPEVGVASLLGLVVGLLDALLGRWREGRRLQELISALVVSAIAAALVEHVRPLLVILTGLIVLVPGLSLTTALAELATRNLVSGTARLTGAGLVLLQLSVGVALAAQLDPEVWSARPATGPSLPEWALWPAVLVAGFSLQVLFAAHLRHLPWVLVSVLVAVAGARAGTDLIGAELGPSLGALGVGVVGNAGARLLRRPAVIGILPGLILLVPGSLGVRALSSLLREDTLAGVDTAFSMVLVGMSIVTGLLTANIVVSPRRSL